MDRVTEILKAELGVEVMGLVGGEGSDNHLLHLKYSFFLKEAHNSYILI